VDALVACDVIGVDRVDVEKVSSVMTETMLTVMSVVPTVPWKWHPSVEMVTWMPVSSAVMATQLVVTVALPPAKLSLPRQYVRMTVDSSSMMDYSLHDSVDSGVSKYLSLFLFLSCVSLAGLQCILSSSDFDMDYVANSAMADFTGDDDATPVPGYDLTVQFTAPSLGVVGTPAEKIEAVVYAASTTNPYKCNYEKILGYTSGADKTSPSGNPDIKNFLTVSVDESAAPTYTVQVLGLDENLPNIPSYSKGDEKANLYICVELQQHGCGKQGFADVLLDIVIDLKSSCETCPIAYIKREGPAKDGDNVYAPDLECYLGPDTPGYTPGEDKKPIFYQGDEIQACIKYNEASLGDSDICFGSIYKFDATIYKDFFCGGTICKGPVGSDNLLALTGNPFIQVGESDCTSDPLEAGLTGECHLSVE